MIELNKVFGAGVREALEHTNLSQNKFAVEAEITVQCLNKIINGKHDPMLSTALKISGALGKSSEEIMTLGRARIQRLKV